MRVNGRVPSDQAERGVRPGGSRPPAAGVLALQRAAGNSAVAGVLGRPVTVQRDVEQAGAPGARPNLEQGDTGPGVTLLQQRLVQHGYVVGVGATFGPATHRAVVRFQEDHPELHPATGGVGRGTWAALDGPVTRTPEGEVDDDLVKDIIRGALWATDDAKREVMRCWDAWAALKARRDAENPAKPGDVNLAAAEHYMFARFLSAGIVPAVVVDVMALSYTAFKTVGARWHAGTGPVTPPSAAQLKWGALGAHDGAWSTARFDEEVPLNNPRAPIGPRGH
ncbi:peptidoglycan-binding domain-containing protein [Longispora sp. K20-0274]|uniref:peptidoglycan-binding domain-containing protein n=1 Tax=Longispora sp. K20-0274 TaxID=3088255 RepID=UPI00399BAFE3